MIQDNIVAYLESVGYTNVFSYQKSDLNDAVFIRVYDSPDGDWHGLSGLTVDEITFFQVMVRGVSDSATETKARAIHRILHARHKVIEGQHIHYMQCLQRPTPFGRDDRDRPQYVFNVEVKHSSPVIGGEPFSDGTFLDDGSGLI